MKLFMVAASPFARKVRVTAAERRLLDRIEIINANPHNRPSELVAANPLSKVPTLIADDGSVHIDSLSICIYLDTLGDHPPIVLLDGEDRWPVLRRHALAHGLMECSVIRRMEGQLKAEPDRLAWMDRQLRATRRTMQHFEEMIDGFGAAVAIDTLTLACALAYLDFRFPEEEWRDAHPRLAAWYAGFADRPALRATEFHA